MKSARQIESGAQALFQEADHDHAPQRIVRAPDLNQAEIVQAMLQAQRIRAAGAWYFAALALSAIGRAYVRVRDHLRETLAVSRAIRELSALDDRTLNDIGISRSEIVMAARGRRKPEAATPAAMPAVSRARAGAAANDACCDQAA